jgi:hypothetical protein
MRLIVLKKVFIPSLPPPKKGMQMQFIDNIVKKEVIFY